jgi:Polyketide cyclase / dehydrase and lipid transport
MITVVKTETIACPPPEFLEFVMDIERYAEVDGKIQPILWSRRDGDLVEFACRPKLAGLRQPKVVQQVRLTPGKRIDIALSPLPANRLAHAIAHFEASFECVAVPGGTEVVRTLAFRFSRPFRWLLEPLLRRRLPAEVSAELLLARQHFGPPPDRPLI